MKLAVVVDSSCGISKIEAEKRGWYFLPLYINIDGKEYSDGIDLNYDNFNKIYNKDSNAKTSCTPIGEAISLFEELVQKYDHIIVYPISQFLSSQFQNLSTAAKQVMDEDVKYKDKISIIESKNVSQMILQELIEIEHKILGGEDIKSVLNWVNTKNRDEPSVLLFVKNMDALVKGGRLRPSAAKMAKLLQIVPVIGFVDGKLEKYDKGRVFSKVVVNSTVDYYEKISKKFKNPHLVVLNSSNDDCDKLVEEIKARLGYDKKVFHFKIPSVIGIHVGSEAIAIAFVDLEIEEEKYNIGN